MEFITFSLYNKYIEFTQQLQRLHMGIQTLYLSLLALYLSGTPSLETGTSPPAV